MRLYTRRTFVDILCTLGELPERPESPVLVRGFFVFGIRSRTTPSPYRLRAAMPTPAPTPGGLSGGVRATFTRSRT